PGRQAGALPERGEAAVGCDRQDRLERVRIIAMLAVEHRDSLGWGDLGPGDPLAVIGAVRPVHREFPYPADAELEGPRGGRETLRTPPLREMSRIGECFEHQLSWRVDLPRNQDLAVGRRGPARRVSPINAHQSSLLFCGSPVSGPGRLSPVGSTYRSRTVRTRRSTRGQGAAPEHPGRTVAACPAGGLAPARPAGALGGVSMCPAEACPVRGPGRPPLAHRRAAASGSPGAWARRSR